MTHIQIQLYTCTATTNTDAYVILCSEHPYTHFFGIYAFSYPLTLNALLTWITTRLVHKYDTS